MPSLFTGLIFPLCMGLLVFLFGMKLMEFALFQWTGSWLKAVLRRMTRSPLRGLLVGTGTTALLQSSSAVSVITIGFVNAGILTFPQTLGIILGTNIGSCITTELIGLKMGGNVTPALLLSSTVWLLTWIPRLRSLAAVSKAMLAIRGISLSIAGFCFILLGIQFMQAIVPYLQEHGLLSWFIEHAQRSLLWGIIAGAILTAVIHSSAAAIAMTMGLAALSMIPVPLGIAIVLGANIGTCATALVASIGGSRFGQYVAYSHILLNIGGAILFYPFITQLHALSAIFTGEPSSQIAHAQTLFNLISSMLALPLCYLSVLRRIQPDAPSRAFSSAVD